MSAKVNAAPALYLAVCTGGAIGAVARYGVIDWLGSGDPGVFPWDTLAVNWLGSLLIGLFFRYWRSLAPDRRGEVPRLFLTTGILGGFTTFSTLSLDTVDLFRHDARASGLLYIAATLIGGLVLCAIGYGLRSPAAVLQENARSFQTRLSPAGDREGIKPSPTRMDPLGEQDDQ